MSRLFAITIAVACALLAVAPVARGQAPLTIEDIWRRPAIAEPTLSPNGRYFAVLAPVNERLNLAVVDLETRKGVTVTSFKDFDVRDVHWVGNERLVFTVGQFNAPSGAGLQEGGGFFTVSRDGKESRQLAPTIRDLRNQNQYVYRAYAYLRSVPGSDEEVIVTGNQRSEDSSDIYRLNVKTGRAVLLSPTRPERVEFSGASAEAGAVDWLLDRNLIPRVAVSSPKGTTLRVVHFRKSESAPWEEIARYDITTGPAFVPLSFERDNETLLVATNAGRATMAVYHYDPAARKLGALVAEHPRFDMGADQLGSPIPGLLLDPKTEEVVGFRVRAAKTETAWTDEKYQRLQAMIDGALPGAVNVFARTPSGNRFIVTSYSDRQSTRWYLLDEEKKTLEELFASRPWLKPEQLVEMRPMVVKTSDGLELPGYYFLPKDHKPGQRLPTIVHVHGGPGVRADWWGQFTFGVREAQLFASRGYAVIVPNHRITPGLGSKIFYSGFGAYGREMVQDHVAAAKWGIEQGFADPARVCISGASYGGAAVLLSLQQAPDVFRCGVAGLVVADTKLELTSPVTDFAHDEGAVKFWLRMLGADSTSNIAPVTSPVNFADRIKQPLLIYAGADDVRTPLEQTRSIQRALERAGNPPKAVIVKAGEGHGYGKLENNIELYTEVLKFLDKSIGAASVQ
jgi:dipeptidyl aminopeptidase/acylaminoacyl peptidase